MFPKGSWSRLAARVLAALRKPVWFTVAPAAMASRLM